MGCVFVATVHSDLVRFVFADFEEGNYCLRRLTFELTGILRQAGFGRE